MPRRIESEPVARDLGQAAHARHGEERLRLALHAGRLGIWETRLPCVIPDVPPRAGGEAPAAPGEGTAVLSADSPARKPAAGSSGVGVTRHG